MIKMVDKIRASMITRKIYVFLIWARWVSIFGFSVELTFDNVNVGEMNEKFEKRNFDNF